MCKKKERKKSPNELSDISVTMNVQKSMGKNK